MGHSKYPLLLKDMYIQLGKLTMEESQNGHGGPSMVVAEQQALVTENTGNCDNERGKVHTCVHVRTCTPQARQKHNFIGPAVCACAAIRHIQRLVAAAVNRAPPILRYAHKCC